VVLKRVINELCGPSVGYSWLALAIACLFANAGKLTKENEENRSSTISLSPVRSLNAKRNDDAKELQLTDIKTVIKL